MKRRDLEDFAKHLAAADGGGEDTGNLLTEALATAFPGMGDQARRLGRQPADMGAMLEVVSAAFPGWAIALRGKAALPDGGWTCSLRENSLRDDDDVIGIGKARTPTLALAAAALLAQARRELHEAQD
jgi:hypothetical protein